MARKVNTKFVGALGGAAILLVGTGVAGYAFREQVKDLFRPSLDALEKQGDDAYAAGDYDLATDIYGKAASRARNNVGLQIKFVDAFDYTVNGDTDKALLLRKYYNEIFQFDTRNLPVMRRLLRMQLSDARSQPQVRANLRSLSDLADHILEQEPKDRDARKAKITAVLEPYRRNLEVSSEELSVARDSAMKLYEEQPDDGELLMMIAGFNLEEARDFAAAGAAAELGKSLEASKVFFEEAVKKTPQAAEAHFAFYFITRAYAGLMPGLSVDKRQELNKQAEAALAEADKLAKPSGGDSEQQFLAIRASAIGSLELRDPKAVEARYRQLMTEVPNSRAPRLLLAQWLAKSPGRRDDAAAVLEAKWKPQRTLRAIESLDQRGLDIQEQLRLCTIRLGGLETVTNPQERETRLKQIEDVYAQLAALPRPGGILIPWMRRIQGGIALQRGKISEAIDNLDNALKLLPADSQSREEIEVRNEVLLEYASAHMQLGQTGKARPALQELVSRDPVNFVARFALAKVLVAEQRYDEARKHVDLLKRVFPDNPQVAYLILQLDSVRTEAFREEYKGRPETTLEQRRMKGWAAAKMNDVAEVARLARLRLATDAADSEAALTLADVLLRQNQRDEALVVLDAAMKVKPNDSTLINYRKSVAAETPGERAQLIASQIDSITDPYQREMTRAEVQRQQGQLDEAMASLRKAEAIEPANPKAIDAQFPILIAQKKFTEAQNLLDRLSKMDTDEAGDEVKRIRLTIARAYEEPDAAERQRLLDEALKNASRVSLKYPEIAGPSLLYAQLLQNAGNFKDAIELYAQTLEKAPNSIDALRGSVQSLMAMNRGSEARKKLEDARKLAPNDAGLRDMELELELTSGDPLRAIDTLTDTLAKNQENPQAWYQLGYAFEQAGQKKTQNGDLAAAKDLSQRAADHWARAMAKFPDNLRFASAYADSQRRLGNPGAAEKAIESLLGIASLADKPEVTELLATQYERSGKPDQAERVLRTLLDRVKPMPSSTLLRLAMLYVQQQQLPQALAVLDQKKDDPDIRRTRIELLIAANDLNAARQSIEEALAVNPTPDIYLVAGFVELRSGQFEKADGFIAKVLQARPSDPAALFYRAQIRLNSTPPNPDGAKEDLLKVISVSPSNVEARLTLADMYRRRGDSAAAVRELESAWSYNRGAKVVLLRLIEAYTQSSPPRTSDAQGAVDQAKESPQLASDPDVILAEASLNVTKNPGKARDLVKKLLATAPDNPAVQQQYYDIILKSGGMRDLLKESEETLQKDRGAWWLYRLRGLAYNKLAQKTDAAKEFDAALNLVVAAQNEQLIGGMVRTIAQELGIGEAIKRLEPLAKTDLSAKLLLASLYQTNNEAGKSLDLLERVNADRDRMRPDQVRTLLQSLGTAYLQAAPAQPRKARETYEALLKLAPNDLLLLNNLAYVNTLPDSGGNLKTALEYSTRAYEMTKSMSSLDESVLYVWDTHGWVLVLNGQMFEGRDLLRQAADRAKFPDVHLHLAEAYLMDNDLDRAQQAIQSAETIITSIESLKQPLDPSIRPKLDQLNNNLSQKRRGAVGAAQ